MSPKNHDTDHYFASEPKSEEKFGLIRTSLCGKNFEFLTSSSVFSKRRVDLGTRILIESMDLPMLGYVLDVGCGYGAVGIVAAVLNPKLSVIMTDVNMRAVHLARKNVRLNKVSNAEVRYGYFYEPVEGLVFDRVLSNPPVSAGMETVTAIVKEATKVMSKRATLQMVIRSKIGAKVLPTVFNETFGNCTVLERRSGFRVLMGKRLAV
jgi:16S rRNA (guanine1207-N2)-methyltransferase